MNTATNITSKTYDDVLKNTVKFSKNWVSACRGFHLNSRGPASIMLKGNLVRGYWVYGYPIPTREGFTILYGSDVWSEAILGETAYTVVPETVCRCTGMLTNGFPIFEYDVVDAYASATKQGIRRNYQFPDAYLFWNAMDMSWGIMTPTGKAYPINCNWAVHIKGTIFDAKEARVSGR